VRLILPPNGRSNNAVFRGPIPIGQFDGKVGQTGDSHLESFVTCETCYLRIRILRPQISQMTDLNEFGWLGTFLNPTELVEVT
jgi:hypothetical protein